MAFSMDNYAMEGFKLIDFDTQIVSFSVAKFLNDLKVKSNSVVRGIP